MKKLELHSRYSSIVRGLFNISICALDNRSNPLETEKKVRLT